MTDATFWTVVTLALLATIPAAWAGTALLNLAHPAPLTPERWRSE